MGLLYNTWNEFQQQQYDTKNAVVTAAFVAFAVVVTQYFVSQWIWFGGKPKGDPHHSPVYLVSIMIFWFLWSVCTDIITLEDKVPLPLSCQIAAPLLVLVGVPLHLLFCWAWPIIFARISNANEGNDGIVEEAYMDYGAFLPSSNTTDTEQALTQNGDARSARPRVHFISNIKIFLTNLVIVHHAACCISNFSPLFGIPVKSVEGSLGDILLGIFMTINQSYFMNLFFFLSGFFVPESFDRRGTYGFLMERSKRLGIPFVLYSFFIGPFIDVEFQYLFLYKGGDERFPNFVLKEGVTWFLLHLMVFNIVYAFACGKGWSPTISCPSFWGFLAIAAVLGLISGCLSMVFEPGEFAIVPLFWNEYVSYFAFFFGGAIAQRNHWMEDIKEMSRTKIYRWAIASVISIPVVFGGVAQSGVFWAQWLCSGFFVFGGLCSVSFSLAVTVFFMDHMDKSYWFADFFDKSMYTAYILHLAFPLQAATKCWILVLEATNNIVYVDNEAQGIAGIYYYIENSSLVLPGFLFVAVVGLIITWPLAYAIRSIPGFSKVL